MLQNLSAQQIAGYALIVVYSFFLSAIAFFSACQIPAANSDRAANTTVAEPSPHTAPSPATASSDPAAGLPVTLPLLDAMFAEEGFAEDLKRSAGLSDEEVARLRDKAREAVLTLGDPEITDDSRSTRESARKGESVIREIVGQEKANAVLAFVRERWGGRPELAQGSAPGSVPTDSRIVVNAPAYRMDVFRDGQLVKSYKVGIGYPEFPLPVGLRKADKIIFNPTWTPPDEPWVKGKVQPGKTVEAGSKLNPLGPIKIPIGLPSLIHGGKDPSRLGTFASHGCVGLTNAMVQDFAVLLSSLSGKPLTLEEVKGYQKQKTETEEVALPESVPVELRYETIVVENGVLKIYRDVYEKGTNNEENLRTVLSANGVQLESLDPAIREQIMTGLNSMALDAAGKPVEPETANSNAKRSNSDKVTRRIKGEKEFAITIPQLSGKGYPAPVDMRS